VALRVIDGWRESFWFGVQPFEGVSSSWHPIILPQI
jgi:hypothetical protein